MALPHDPVVAACIGLVKHHCRLLRLWPIGKMLLRLAEFVAHAEIIETTGSGQVTGVVFGILRV
jgi:hypothetical protein